MPRSAPRSRKLTKADRAFLTSRARAGGAARAARYSPLWQKLNMHFLTERRLKTTTAATFKEWLRQHGFEKLAAAPLRQSGAVGTSK